MNHSRKSVHLAIGVAIWLLASCSGSSFSGGENGGSNGNNKRGPSGAASGSPNGGASPNGGVGTGPSAGSSIPDSGGPNDLGSQGGNLTTTCVSTPSYNPLSVECSIGVADPSNGWHVGHGGSWDAYLGRFRDKTANFISSLAPFTESGGGRLCPPVPSAEKLIYVSYFDVPAAGTYNIDALVDDTGTLRLWKGSDPAQERLNVVVNPAALSQNAVLEQGRYAVIMDGSNTAPPASAAAFSIQDSTGKVIKNSTSDGSWCVFRVSASENVSTFVNTNAGCLPCLGRVNK